MFMFFFFQAEDGIRDLVRSRGLGDVYKRQKVPGALRQQHGRPGRVRDDRHQHRGVTRIGLVGAVTIAAPVSYTHLTLPTSDLV